jgi:hypothetical protein
VKRILALYLAAFLIPLVTLADGGIIPRTALQAKVTIPDQRALLCWSNGVERLAIDTHFIGEGTNFAWVVPLPSQPVIEEATPGLFNTLDYIFRPSVVHAVFPLYAILIFCTGVGYLLLTVRRNTEPRISDMVVSVIVGLVVLPISACFAIPVAVLLPWSVWRVRVGKEGWWAMLAVLFFLFVLSGMLLPALGTAGSAAAQSDKVTILGQERIGAYDTTTVASKDPRALVQWLSENNYAVPDGVENVVSNYVKRGWVFAASKLHRESAQAVDNSPPLLCFTFRTDKAVYPMQLTRIGNTNLDVELFVFGPSRAEAKFFTVDHCSIPIFSDSHYRQPDLSIVHPLLQKWTKNSQIATKLNAHLTSDQMKDDVELQWVPFKELRRTIYSKQGAAIVGLNWGAALFCGCLLLGSLIIALKREQRSAMKLVSGFAGVVGIVTAALLFITLPKTEVRLVRMPGILSVMTLRQLDWSYSEAVGKGSSPAQARELIAKFAHTNENVLLGGMIHEEDSPGNYIFLETTNGFDFVRFDANGGAHTNW